MANKNTYAMELHGGQAISKVKLIGGIVEGGINEMPTALVEFVSPDKALDLGSIVGSDMGYTIKGADNKDQIFHGVCISAEFKGTPDADSHYFAEIKPWLYFLTRSHNNRIFQQMNTLDIVTSVLGDYGFSGFIKTDANGEQTMRDYCVQYRETDLEFIKRLLEEDGLYFYFEYEVGQSRLVIADNVNSHASTENDTLPFIKDSAETQKEHIFEWEAVERAVSGKVTLDDYNFLTPRADLTSTSTTPKGSHQHKDYELYSYPGRYRETSEGERYAKQAMEAEAAGHRKWRGAGNVFNLRPGQLFSLADAPRAEESNTFMLTKARQVFRLQAEGKEKIRSLLEEMHDFGLSAFEHTKVTFEAVMKSETFRMPMITPRPSIAGVHTAVVTGPAGEEIYCDEHGRIKVQFHWDRHGKNDDVTSCWVRVMTPWAGKGWGAVSIPRIGQEVVIQFEEGDPDRPLCVGMLYNADNMPPYGLPAHATRSGIKSNSSKGGNGFNEMVFDDKKGNEMVLVNAEKDFFQRVQHTSHTVVGYPRKDGTVKSEADGAGSMKLEIQNNLDEFIDKGDHRFTLDTGSQIIKIKTDKTETITGKSTRTVTGNVTQKVTQGNHSNTVSKGNFSVKATAGTIDMSAAQKITLKCGGSKIVMTPTDIKITSINIKADAQVKFEAKGGVMAAMEGGVRAEVKGGAVAEVTGNAMLTLKGGITMIN